MRKRSDRSSRWDSGEVILCGSERNFELKSESSKSFGRIIVRGGDVTVVGVHRAGVEYRSEHIVYRKRGLNKVHTKYKGQCHFLVSV